MGKPNITDKVLVIPWASGGLGESTARLLVANGATGAAQFGDLKRRQSVQSSCHHVVREFFVRCGFTCLGEMQ